MSDHWRRAQLQQVATEWDSQASHAESTGAEHAGFWRRMADKARADVDAWIEMSEELD